MANNPTDANIDVIREIYSATQKAFAQGKPVHVCHTGSFSAGVTLIAIPAMIEGAIYKVEHGNLVEINNE